MFNVELRRSDWIPIDTQDQLEVLDRSVCWADSRTVAFVGATRADQEIFPQDVSRSGHLNWDIRILFLVGLTQGSHLEIGCADCDEFSADLFSNFSLQGRIDSLKRVAVYDRGGQRLFRCSRVVYRFLNIDQQAALTYYGFGPRDGADSP